MRIKSPQKQTPRTAPVKFGEGSRGRRYLIQAAMEAGFSKRVAAKTVDTIIKTWTEALCKQETVEVPLGDLKVKKVPTHLYKLRKSQRNPINRSPGVLKTWTIFNDRYQVLWRLPDDEWKQLVEELNPKNHS